MEEKKSDIARYLAFSDSLRGIGGSKNLMLANIVIPEINGGNENKDKELC